MLTIFLEHKILSGFFLLFLLLSIICQIMIGVIYQKMIKETENMSSTNNKMLKQCKMKFTNCYQLNKGVSNIPVFVDKFLNKMSIMRITMRNVQHLSGQFMLLSILAAGIGACRAIMKGETLGGVLPYYIVSFLELYIYFSVSGIVDIQGKKERLKTNLVDYLENHMVNKLKQTELDQVTVQTPQEKIIIMEDKTAEKTIEITAEKTAEKMVETGKAAAEKKEKKHAVFSQQEKKELEELLQEFLV